MAADVSIRLSTKGGEEVRRSLQAIGKDGSEALRKIREESPRAAAELENAADAIEETDLATSKMTKTVKTFTAVAGAVAAVAAAMATGAVKFALAAAEAATETLRSADAAGIGAEAYQELGSAAVASGVKLDDAGRSLEAFNRVLGDAKTGLSPEALKAFKALGFTEEEVRGFANAEEALGAVAERIAGVSSAAGQAAIAEKLGLRDLLPLLLQGKDGMDDLREAARAAGAVIGTDTLQAGKALDAQFKELSTTVGRQLKGAILDLAPVIQDVLGFAQDWIRGLTAAIAQLRAQRDADTNRARVERVSELAPRAARAEENLRVLGSLTPERRGDSLTFERQVAEAKAIIAEYRAARRELVVANLRESTNLEYPRAAAPPPPPPAPDRATPARSARGSTRSSRAAAAPPAGDAIGDAGARATVDVLAAAARYEEQAIERLARLEDVAKNTPTLADKLAIDEETARRWDDFTTDLAGGLAAAVVYGENLGDTLLGVIKRVAFELIQSQILSLLNGGGPGADGAEGGNIGSSIVQAALSIFGGGRATGGPVSAGRAYMVGERGPELFLPGQSGGIVPNGALGGVSVTVNNYAGVETRVREGQGADGRPAVEIDIVELARATVRQEVDRSFASGRMDVRLADRYGVNPRLGGA